MFLESSWKVLGWFSFFLLEVFIQLGSVHCSVLESFLLPFSVIFTAFCIRHGHFFLLFDCYGAFCSGGVVLCHGVVLVLGGWDFAGRGKNVTARHTIISKFSKTNSNFSMVCLSSWAKTKKRCICIHKPFKCTGATFKWFANDVRYCFMSKNLVAC